MKDLSNRLWWHIFVAFIICSWSKCFRIFSITRSPVFLMQVVQKMFLVSRFCFCQQIPSEDFAISRSSFVSRFYTLVFGQQMLLVHILPSTLCYRLLRKVHCIYSRLSHYRPTRTDYCTSLRQCHLALLSQLLLSLKLLPPLHSCRSSIVRVKRYSYCFVPPLPNIDTQRAPLLYRSTFRAIASLHSVPPVSTISR